MKALSQSNYILRKACTHKTQCAHRMRLRKFIKHKNVPALQVDESQFYTDPDVIDKPVIFHDETPQLTPTPTTRSSPPTLETLTSKIHNKPYFPSNQSYQSYEQPTSLYTRYLHLENRTTIMLRLSHTNPHTGLSKKPGRLTS